MKIAILNSKLGNSNTGAEKFVVGLAENLAKKGHEVYILASTDSSNIKNIKIERVSLSKNKIFRKILFDYFNPFSYISLKRVLSKINPDIVHVNNFYGISAWAIKKMSQKYPTIITAHDYWLICYRATMFNKEIVCDGKNCKCYYPLSVIHKSSIRKNLSKITIISPSNFLANKLKESNEFRKIVAIPNGIDIPKNTTSYSKKIIFVGRISREKGLQTVIEALNKVNNKYEVYILGSGKLKEELQSKYGNVKFIGYQDPSQFYKNSSIMVVPSIWFENFSYSVLEAMSYGLCVIASNIGGIPEQIKNGKSGVLYEPGNIQEFQAALEHLTKKPQKLKNLGLAGRTFIKTNFNWKRIVKKYEGEYIKELKRFKLENER